MDKVSYAVTAFWLLASMTFLVNFKNLENSHRSRINTSEVISKTNEICTYIAEAENFQRNYLLIGNQEYLDYFLTSEAKILPAVDNIKKITTDNKAQQTRLKLVEDIAKFRLKSWHETLDTYKKSGFDAARKKIVDNYNTSGIVKMGELKRSLAEVASEEEKLLTIREKQNERDFTNSKNCIYAAFVISIFIFLFPLVNFLRKT